MAHADRSLLGAAIAASLALYAVTAERRERRLSADARDGHHAYGRPPIGPEQITARGWWEILKRVQGNIGRHNLSLMAAGIAFYALLSLTPAFTALVALYGLVFEPTQVEAQMASMENLMPAEARTLVANQLTTIVQHSSSALSIGLVISLVLAIWSANSGTGALMSALNVIYAEPEKRPTLRYYATALGLTGALVLFGIVVLVLVAVMPAVIGFLPLGGFGKPLLEWIRWPVLLIFLVVALAVIYRYAPCHSQPRRSWVSWGALAATLLWLGGSALFSLYVATVASYSKTYGSLGAVVVLLMWFWVSAFAVLLGAELNAEMEHTRDAMQLPRKPRG